ncbi:MAG: ABC transporter permease [Rhodanobacter sp.]|nr:MAG: ABC transporter permease [Rhodanobacter sp.]TAM07420.1 MAG: ABC transporter permease [Rhodanobacter sp.]TAM38487.1 MAG: ABC transporter permease [Rhodanobacter sp.]TAN27053.1 MAG: ABC transporter permease [Rhodanobacter sp.]
MRRLFNTWINGRLRAQIVKELLSILRDPRSRLIVFAPPLLQLLIFTFATTLEVRNANIAVYNQDTGHWSYEMEARVGAAEFVNKVYTVHNRDQLRRLIDQRKVIAALDMGPDFSRDIVAGGTGKLQVIVDGRRSNAGQITVGYLNAIAANVGSAARKEPQRASPVVVRHWFNPNLIYRWFVVPALSGILVFFSALMITALSIARERELGTFDQLLVSPTTTLEIIVAKTVPALAIGTVLGLMMIAAAAFLFGVPFTGSFWLLLPSLLLFIASVVGIGLMISAVSATQQQAIMGAFAIGVPAVLMSGFATPVENMPLVLQWIAQGIPLTHFLVIVEGTFLKAMPASDILANTWPLAVIALVSLTLATLLVRSRLQ